MTFSRQLKTFLQLQQFYWRWSQGALGSCIIDAVFSTVSRLRGVRLVTPHQFLKKPRYSMLMY